MTPETISVETKTPMAMFIHPSNIINGVSYSAADGKRFEVENPADRSIIASVPDAGIPDAVEALNAAVEAQPSWSASTPNERNAILMRAHELVLAELETIAEIITCEMGKPLTDARGEVRYAAEFLSWFAGEALRIGGDHLMSGDGKNRFIVSQEPVGPCVLVTPWNFPLAMGARKIGPALAAGCTVLFKPAEQTPLTALYFVELLHRAGLPAGVVNVVTTQRPADIVGLWLKSGLVRKISFTGSTAVGKLLLEQAAKTVMRTSMELGGNAPFIVFEDADIDAAVDGAIVAKMRNMGEACTAINRMYVHESVASTFISRFAEKMSSLKMLPGLEPGSEVGPLIDQQGFNKVAHLVRDAISKGARVVTGGVPEGDTLFFPPTVLVDMPASAELYNTEIFGPVAPIVTFTGEANVIELANDTKTGLVGYIYTKEITRAFRVASAMEVGMVGINTGLVSNPRAPFGGVKDSGLGREGGTVGIEEFLEYKYIALPNT